MTWRPDGASIPGGRDTDADHRKQARHHQQTATVPGRGEAVRTELQRPRRAAAHDVQNDERSDKGQHGDAEQTEPDRVPVPLRADHGGRAGHRDQHRDGDDGPAVAVERGGDGEQHADTVAAIITLGNQPKGHRTDFNQTSDNSQRTQACQVRGLNGEYVAGVPGPRH